MKCIGNCSVCIQHLSTEKCQQSCTTNARPNVAQRTLEKLNELGYETHPSYRPGISTDGYHFYTYLDFLQEKSVLCRHRPQSYFIDIVNERQFPFLIRLLQKRDRRGNMDSRIQGNTCPLVGLASFHVGSVPVYRKLSLGSVSMLRIPVTLCRIGAIWDFYAKTFLVFNEKLRSKKSLHQ